MPSPADSTASGVDGARPPVRTTTAASANDDVTADPAVTTEQPRTTEQVAAPSPFVVDGSSGLGSWNIVFQDEFEESEIDESRWTACYWWDRRGCTNLGTGELQWYRPDQRSIDDGMLRLWADEDPFEASDGENYRYRSGMVTSGRSTNDFDTLPRFGFTYGYVEARIRAPQGQGLWPAVWMLPLTHEARPEIDIVEVLGHRPEKYELHFHTRDDDGDRISFGGDYTGEELADGWHTVAVDWRPDAVVWMIDGVERWRVEELVPDEPMYLLANLAVGGEWPGAPDEFTEFPASFDIDYVRVWQRGDPLFTSTGSASLGPD